MKEGTKAAKGITYGGGFYVALRRGSPLGNWPSRFYFGAPLIFGGDCKGTSERQTRECTEGRRLMLMPKSNHYGTGNFYKAMLCH